MLKLIILTIIFVVGVSMILYTTKQYDKSERNKRYLERRDYTGFEVVMIIIGSTLSILSLIVIMPILRVI